MYENNSNLERFRDKWELKREYWELVMGHSNDLDDLVTKNILEKHGNLKDVYTQIHDFMLKEDYAKAGELCAYVDQSLHLK